MLFYNIKLLLQHVTQIHIIYKDIYSLHTHTINYILFVHRKRDSHRVRVMRHIILQFFNFFHQFQRMTLQCNPNFLQFLCFAYFFYDIQSVISITHQHFIILRQNNFIG
eukprot:407963_1